MRTIKEQIVASTNYDLHGDKLGREQLLNLFDQMPDEQILNRHHDLSKPPIGKLYNKQFKSLNNGEYAIIADIDIYDEQAFSEYGGFSISYTGNRTTLNPDRLPEVDVLYNPLFWDANTLHPLLTLSNESLQIDLVELKQKQLEEIVTLIIRFAALSAAAGFFGKFGADIYDALKTRLRNIAERQKIEKNTDILFHVLFTADYGKEPLEVLIELNSSDLELTNQNTASIDSAIEYVKKVVGNSNIKRVALKMLEQKPFWEINYFIDNDGKIVTLG